MPSATTRRGGANAAAPGAAPNSNGNSTLNGDSHSDRGESPVTSETNASKTKSDLSNAASTLRAVQQAASIEDAAPENLKQVFKALDKRRRNMEKRSERLAEYKARLAQGENLNKDQREAASHYEEVLGAISFAKELTESLHKLAVDATREEKQQIKAAAAEKKAAEHRRLQTVVVFNHALRTISNPLSQEMLLSGSESAPQLTPDELATLVAVSDSVQVGPRQRDAAADGSDAASVPPEDAAENLAALLDAVATKRVTSTHSYADAQALLNKVIESEFCDTVDLTPKQPESCVAESETEDEEDEEEEDSAVEVEAQAEEAPLLTEEPSEESSFVEASSADAVSSTVDDLQLRSETAPEKKSTPPGFESSPPPLMRQDEVHQQMEVTSTSDAEQKAASTVHVDESASSFEASSVGPSECAVASPKDEGNCYSFTLPPPRPFHQVIQSVQGSFDFLQDSQIELTSISSPSASAVSAPVSADVASGAVAATMESGHSSAASQPLTSAPTTVSSLSHRGIGSAVGANAEPMASSISSSLSAAFHDASPMIDDPAVMHVTAGTSTSLLGSSLMSTNSLPPNNHGPIGTPERISHSNESSSHLHRNQYGSSSPKTTGVHRALDAATLEAAAAPSRTVHQPQQQHGEHEQQPQRPHAVVAPSPNDAYQIHSKATNISDASDASSSTGATTASFTLTGISPASHSNLPNSSQNLLNAKQVSKRSNALSDNSPSGTTADVAPSSVPTAASSSSRPNEGFGVVGSGARVKTVGGSTTATSSSLGLSVSGAESASGDNISFGGESLNFGLQQVSSSLMETNGFGGPMDTGKWPDSNLKSALVNSFITDPSPLDDSSLRNLQDITVGSFPVTSNAQQHTQHTQQQQQQPLSTAALSKEDLSGTMNNMYMEDRSGRGGNRPNYQRHHQSHHDYNHQSKDQHPGYASHRQNGYGGGGGGARQNSISPSVGLNANAGSGGLPKTGSGGSSGRWGGGNGGNGGGGGYGGRNGGGGFRGGAAVRGGYGNRGHGGHLGGSGGGGSNNGGQMRSNNRGMSNGGRNMGYPQ